MMERLEAIGNIQNEKDKSINREGLLPLDPEGKRLAEQKRFTLDLVGVPVDPLR